MLSSATMVETAPKPDGRQSEAAEEIWRGAARLLRRHGYACVGELVLAGGRRADLTALSPKGDIVIVEVKSGLEDFRADGKWPDYLEHCDRFYFAVAPDFPLEVLPQDTGLIVADRYGGEIVREVDEERLNGARRKAVTNRFARAAAIRLHSLIDPGCQNDLL